ncbi:30S ribosomal protein S17 [Candidatus Microgenomates bacterium]|nr:30S ribosomal protein S17 [Candidatus Microgenomates bacterium]
MQKLNGTIISKASPNTVIVKIVGSFAHPKYKKIIKRTTRLAVHNEIEESKIGDRVEIVKTRPYSRRKNFKILKII